uniref:Uncharacterized protein n=1 Tax=Rhizophora mucronata TaxID=61149 RepID=A0A2P2PBA8_RHIMU
MLVSKSKHIFYKCLGIWISRNVRCNLFLFSISDSVEPKLGIQSLQ